MYRSIYGHAEHNLDVHRHGEDTMKGSMKRISTAQIARMSTPAWRKNTMKGSMKRISTAQTARMSTPAWGKNTMKGINETD